MTTQTYITKQGDTIDVICLQYYKRTDNRICEIVLERNTGLAQQGPIFDEGIAIQLPDPQETNSNTNIIDIFS